ncbi:MAG: hypothetical protein R2697_09015 [Ilumatobacteraceae bacterium]
MGDGDTRCALRAGGRPAQEHAARPGRAHEHAPLPPEKQIPQIEVLSVAEIIAEALSAVFDDTSVSDIFDGENLA